MSLLCACGRLGFDLRPPSPEAPGPVNAAPGQHDGGGASDAGGGASDAGNRSPDSSDASDASSRPPPTDQAELEAAIVAANANPGHDSILLGDITVTDELPDINDGASLTDGVTITSVPGTVITIDGALPVHLFESDDANTHILGLTIVAADYEVGGGGNGHHIIRFEGDDSSAVGNTIKGFVHYAIRVQGADRAYIAGNHITGGTGVVRDDEAAIVLTDTQDTVFVDNVVVRNNFDNVQIENARGLVFDHNTIADSATGAGLRFIRLASSLLCMRSNLVTHHATYGIDMTLMSTTWAEVGACVEPLVADIPTGYRYENAWAANGAGAADDCCALAGACVGSCTLPAGRFALAVATPYTSREGDEPQGYCPTAAELIDAAEVLDASYDLNGEQAGGFNGLAPDIGARETGFAGCP